MVKRLGDVEKQGDVEKCPTLQPCHAKPAEMRDKHLFDPAADQPVHLMVEG